MSTNSAHESYLDTLVHIRERLHTLNAQLPTNRASHSTESDPLLSTDGMVLSQSDRALLLRGKQAATQSFAFRASLSEFSQHWETMTSSQQHKHLLDYIDGQYNDHEQLDDIRTFLVQTVLKTVAGSRHVTWNGYFVEYVTGVEVVRASGRETRVRWAKPATTMSPTTTQSTQSNPSSALVSSVSSGQSSLTTPVVSSLPGGGGAMATATATPAAITATTVVVPTNRKKGGVKAKPKPKARGGGSFQAMRNRVRREKAGFFMGD